MIAGRHRAQHHRRRLPLRGRNARGAGRGHRGHAAAFRGRGRAAGRGAEGDPPRGRHACWTASSACPPLRPEADGAAEALARAPDRRQCHGRASAMAPRPGSSRRRAIRPWSAGRATSRRRISPMNIWRSANSRPGSASWSGLLERAGMTLSDHRRHARSALPARCRRVRMWWCIGGGVIGVMTAWFLAERGLSVRAVRKGPDRGRTIQPQLGLDPPAGPRPGRIADHDRKPVDLETPGRRDWARRWGSGRTGVMYLAKTEARDGGVRGLDRTCPRASAGHAAADRGRDAGGC